MGEFRFRRGAPPPKRFVEHVLSDATLKEIGERWGLSESAARYWRNKLKAEQAEAEVSHAG